jgi:hypothetical protein
MNSSSKLNKLFWKTVSRYYAVFLILVISFSFFGFFILYRDFYLLKQSKPIVSLSKLKVEEDKLSELLEEIEEKELKTENIEEKEYFNPFEKNSPESEN